MTENAQLTKEELLQELEKTNEMIEVLFDRLKHAYKIQDACLQIIKHLQK